MFKASLKGVWAHKLRLALTALAIILGVGLISGVYVYTDTIGKAFEGIFADAFEGVDIVVTAESDFTFGEGAYMDEATFNAIGDVEGVDAIFPFIQAFGIAPLDADGEPIGGQGPPQLGANLVEGDTSGFVIREGDYPVGPDQIALDAGTAEANEFAIGDTVAVITPTAPPRDYTLVGVAGFGEEDNLGGSTWVFFDLPTAQAVMERPGVVSGGSVQVVGGADVDQVIERIVPLMPESVSVLSGQSAAEEQAADLQEQLGFIATFLAVFGYIALFVGSFLIYNTFQIVVRQRTQELALMRALGASRRQVNQLVLLEAAIIGVIGSVLGLGFGLTIAVGLQQGLSAAGFALPTTTLSLQPRTIVVGLLSGVIVTLVSAILPAVRASRVPVMAALREDAATPARRGLAKRIVSGSVVVAAGMAFLFYGLFASIENGPSPITYVGLGAAVIFIGMFILSPLFARWATGWLGAPFERLYGMTGRLARENAMRSPRRSAATAVAVMISITLVALASVLIASFRGTIDDVLSNDIAADVIVLPENQFDPTASFTPQLAADIAALPEVEATTRLQVGPVIYNDSETFISGVEANFAEFFPPETSQGDLSPGPGEMVMDEVIAENDELAIGDTITVQFEQTGEQAFTLVGTGGGSAWTGVIALTQDDWVANFGGIETDSQVYARAAAGIDQDALKAAIEPLVEAIPTVNVQTFDELRSDAEQQLNTLLNIVLGLLGVTVLIGMLGVTNTMTLSVFERTREIGLLRAVGLDRRGTRRMVRSEASIVSVFGSLLGIAIGIFFGWALVRALEDVGLTSFVIPWLPSSASVAGVLGSLLFWVAATAILGVVFAVYPARRAAKINVLEAIAYE